LIFFADQLPFLRAVRHGAGRTALWQISKQKATWRISLEEAFVLASGRRRGCTCRKWSEPQGSITRIGRRRRRSRPTN
jgi:hypothetical protein